MRYLLFPIVAVFGFSLAAQTFILPTTDVGAQGISEAELERLNQVDPPVRPDPLGNALIGGVVTGTMKGAAAGAASTMRSGAKGSAVDAAKQDIQQQRSENMRTGRGGAEDPRYDPRSLLDR